MCTETIDYKMDAIEIASDVVKYNLWINGNDSDYNLMNYHKSDSNIRIYNLIELSLM